MCNYVSGFIHSNIIARYILSPPLHARVCLYVCLCACVRMCVCVCVCMCVFDVLMCMCISPSSSSRPSSHHFSRSTPAFPQALAMPSQRKRSRIKYGLSSSCLLHFTLPLAFHLSSLASRPSCLCMAVSLPQLPIVLMESTFF
jgi:hypothetical protein